MKKETVTRLNQIGVYGFDKVEPVILAALVTEDPLLLIGETGTGKTFLLNSLSEVLGLEHRHYNASLISFDDLVGFPYPDPANEGVRFPETPATVWGAESVLIDEISRCKPEHQNRLFSLIHERRLQGIALDRLRYRWAAMNPCNADQTSYEDYSGSEPLDPALADRFALFVKAVDWGNLSDGEKKGVADPKGEGALSGKDPSHIDRAASYRAREAAVLAVQSGAKDCLVRLAYARNDPQPLDVDYCMTGIGERQARSFFHHNAICEAYRAVVIDEEMARGGHFFDALYPWNRLESRE